MNVRVQMLSPKLPTLFVTNKQYAKLWVTLIWRGAPIRHCLQWRRYRNYLMSKKAVAGVWKRRRSDAVIKGEGEAGVGGRRGQSADVAD